MLKNVQEVANNHYIISKELNTIEAEPFYK